MLYKKASISSKEANFPETGDLAAYIPICMMYVTTYNDFPGTVPDFGQEYRVHENIPH